MRNLKRALSLALASVMLLGMMVVGTSAASYPDVDENDNVEAIEVLNAVNVMIGRQGNFEPDEAVNRHEMAVIMAKLVLGVEIADNYVGTHPFTDVVPWADKYVAACYENGLVAGTSATTFSGSKNLTAVEAAAMMLRALGYKDLSKGATDWRAPITAMANQIRLFNGVASNPSQQLNRNQVAQLALNTLKSPMVNLKDNTISWTDGEGQIIMTGGGREYIALSSNEAYAKAINDTEKAGTSASQISGYTVELGEHLYNGKLKLNNNNLDVFGRPSRKWEFDGKEIGSYIKEELMVLDKVGKVTGNDLYTLLGSSTIKDYDIRTTIDGIGSERNDAKTVLGDDAYFDATDMNRNNKKEVGATGTGTLTQVFVDHEKDEVYVAVINTYLALASRDYDEKAEEATLTVYGIDDSRNNKDYVKTAKKYETMKVQNEDFALVKDVKKDDPYLVTVADGEIQTMVPDEVLEAVTLTAFKLGDHVVSDGTEYKYTTTATYNIGDLDAYTGNGKENLKDITYNIYLDAYNNLIGIKEIDAVKNYVFLAGIDLDGSNLYNKTATANALFLDGTSKTIKINMAKSKWTAHEDTLGTTSVNVSGHALLNTWCTYSVNGDMYTVNEVHNINPTASKASLAQYHQYTTDYANPSTYVTEDSKVNVKYMRLNGGGNSTDGYSWVYGDSDSVYLIAGLDELMDDYYTTNSYAVISDVDSVTTGIADASITVWSRDEARKQADDTKNKWTIPGNSKLDSSDLPPNTGRGENSAEYWISHGIYTLYDDEGIVIAAVIVGENEGVKDLVYVHSGSLDLESYADGTWTWTRKVIYKGEEITLTEKGDAVSDLKDMLQYHWYEIKRNANGEILSAEPAWEALGVDFVVDYSKINETVETKGDTVLYQTNDGPAPADDTAVHTHAGINNTLRVIGNNTLAVETLSGSGIHFRDNVNVVLQYWNQNTKQTEVKTGTGVDDLKSMVDFVNDNNPNRGNDLYWLSAVIEKGFATTIVIYDSYNNYDKPEQNVRYLEMPSTSTIADVNKALIDNNVKIMGAWQPNDLVDEVGDRLNTVKIPANRTLYIDGNFIAFENGTRGKGSIYVTPASTSTSKMIVNGNAWLAGQQLDCNMDVYGDLKINTAPDRGSITYLNADFNVSRDLIISDEFTGTNVRVTSGSTVTVGRDLISEKIGMDIDVYGTLNIGRRDDSVNIIHYDVLSSSTLKAGTLYGTFCVGDSSRTGRVEVGTLSTDDATGLHKGATLNNGSLVITGANYTEAFNIGDDAEARIVFGDKAADKAGVFLTEEGTQADVAGKTYVFTEKDGVITVTDANKNKVDTITGSSVDEVTDKGATEGDKSLTVKDVTVGVGGTANVVVTLTPNDSSVTYTYTIADTTIATVATVDGKGVVTGVKEGTTTITVTGSNKLTATAKVTVSASIVAVESVTLNATSAGLKVGDTKQLTATVAPANATDKAVTWTSSNTTVATVSSTGLVTAKAEGSATITAATSNGKTATCAVTVSNTPVVTSDKIRAIKDGSAWAMYLYFGGESTDTATRKLTSAEVIGAIETASGQKVAKLNDTMTGGEYESGEPFTVSAAANKSAAQPGQLFKVTFPGGSPYYAKAGEQVSVSTTAKYLMLKENKVVDTADTTTDDTVIAVTNGKAVLYSSMDADTKYEYVEALALMSSPVTAATVDIYYTGADGETTMTDSDTFIQKGLEVTFYDFDLAEAGKTYMLSINEGTPVSFTYSKDGAAQYKTTINAANDGKKTPGNAGKVTFGMEAGVSVSYNGKAITGTFVDSDKVTLTTKPLTGKLAYVDSNGDLTEIDPGTSDGEYTNGPSGANWIVDTSLVNADGAVELWDVYEVKAQTTDSKIELYETKNADGTLADKVTDGTLFKVKDKDGKATTLYVQYVNSNPVANVFVGVADGKKAELVEVTKPTMWKAGVWSVTLSSDITATEFEVAKQLPAATGSTATTAVMQKAAAPTGDDKLELTIAGFATTDKVTAKWVTPAADDDKVASVANAADDDTVTVTIDPAKTKVASATKLEIVLNASAQTAAETEIGTIEITVVSEGVTYTTRVTVSTGAAA